MTASKGSCAVGSCAIGSAATGSTRQGQSLGLPQDLGAAAWLRGDGYDGTTWTDHIAGLELDGTGHAPGTATFFGKAAVSFNGSNQYVSGGSDFADLVTNQDYTVVTLYSVTALNSSDGIWSAGKSASNDDYLWIATNGTGPGTIRHRHNVGGSNDDDLSVSNTQIGTNELITRYDKSDGEVEIHLNGTLDSPVAKAGGTPTGLDVFSIGALFRNGFASTYFDGDIMEVIIFSRVLTDDEIAQLEAYFNSYYYAPYVEDMAKIAWWKDNTGWDGTKWTDQVAGYEADGTGHAPTTTTVGGYTVLSFNGTSQWLQLPAALLTALGSSDYSVAVAYNASPIASYDSLVTFWEDSSNYVWTTMLAAGNTVSRHTASATIEDEFSDADLVAGNNAIGVTFNGTSQDMAFYRGGGTSGTATMANDMPSSMDDGAIGAWNPDSPNFYFLGEIMEVMIFNTVLTDDEMQAVTTYLKEKYA